jgi:lipopolysaccharide/colanic/teichoic acid biosynthesis glycosyltransferase
LFSSFLLSQFQLSTFSFLRLRPLSTVLCPVVKRAFDLLFSALGLIMLTPVFLVLALAAGVTDGFPILFRQQRVGQRGKLFTIYKFRSMVAGAEDTGLSVSPNGDPRVTRIGRFMRKNKLDELPQLWNVLVGEMSLVGPRPEVPRYVEMYTQEQKRVLALKPGITDLATLEFRNEEELLRRAEDGGRRTVDGRTYESEMERFYVEYCVPRKIELSLAYAAGANLWEDTKVILRTLCPCLPLRSHCEKGTGTSVRQSVGP